MLVFDKNRFGSKREIDEANGYLRVTGCNITKSQIRPYYGKEIPGWRDFDIDPDTIYNVYCPEEELKKALESFNNLPLTREHIEVDVENVPKDKIVGSLGDHAEYKRPYVKNNLIVYDKKDIDWILSGKKKELSCGYRYTPVRQSGEFDGKHYDFVMTDIIGNHVALVREGRAGHDVMVADESPNFTESQNDNTINTKENEMLANDEFKEADHPRDKDGKFTTAGRSSSGSSLKDDKDVENYWQGSGSKESQGAGVVKVMKKQLEDLKAEHKKIFGKSMFVSKEEQERGEMIGKQIKDLEDEIAKKESEGSEKKEERGTYENFKSPIANKIGNWYGPQGEESADKARAMREMEWTAHKIKTENNPEEKKELERDLDWEKSQFEKKFGEKPEKYGFGGSEKKETAGKEVSMGERIGSLKDSLKSQLSNEITKDPKKLRELAKNDEALTRIAEVTNMGQGHLKNALNEMADELEGSEKKEESSKEDGRSEIAKPNSNKRVRIAKNGEEYMASYGQEMKSGVPGEEYKSFQVLKTKSFKDKAGAEKWAQKIFAEDEEIPEKAGKPEKAGDEVALNQGETKMAEEVKEAPAEKKVEETKKEEVVEDACKKAEDKKEVKPACDEKEDKRKLIDEIGGILKGKLSEEDWRTVVKKAEELAYNDSERSADDKKLAKDEDKKDLKGKEQKAFAEGVEYGEKKEKEEPKKLDSEHESEGMKKAEKEMAKDSALAMDVDAIKAQVREEVMADFKAREEARKAVRGFVGDVNVMAFDSAEDIYKFACGKSGMDLNEIVSFKDAFKGLSAGKSKALALDASPVSGSNEECLKDIRIA